MPQLALDFSEPETAESGRALTTRERFEAWLEQNGHIYEAFKSVARKLRANGRDHYGAKGICEYLRFNSALESKGDVYKINNLFSAYLARKLVAEDESFRGFFEFRRTSSLEED